MTTQVSRWQKASIIATFVLALFTGVMAGFTWNAADKTSRMADETARSASETAKMTELTEQGLQANLLVGRWQYLKGRLDEEREVSVSYLWEYLQFLVKLKYGEGMPVSPQEETGFCNTLGEGKTFCEMYYKYQTAFCQAGNLCDAISKDISNRQFSPASEKIPNLESKLCELAQIYADAMKVRPK